MLVTPKKKLIRKLKGEENIRTLLASNHEIYNGIKGYYLNPRLSCTIEILKHLDLLKKEKQRILLFCKN